MNKEAVMTGNAVAYLRVSTDRQGRSGLGLEAQREAVARYARDTGLAILSEFVEVETGKGANALAKRPQLLAALAEAKRTKARLVLAKLDRLARNVHFISGLMETGVDFAVADMPNADRFQLHLFAALAEKEAAMISQRTKAALAAAKSRGQVLGKHGKVIAAQNKADAVDRVAPLAGTFADLRREGMNMRQMVTALNNRGVPSPGGGKWHLANLHRALKRADALTNGSAPASASSGDALGERFQDLTATLYGDFYEFMGDAASAVAKALDMVVMRRDGLPVAGIPAHSAERYFNLLQAAGMRVTIAG